MLVNTFLSAARFLRPGLSFLGSRASVFTPSAWKALASVLDERIQLAAIDSDLPSQANRWDDPGARQAIGPRNWNPQDFGNFPKCQKHIRHFNAPEKRLADLGRNDQ
jgi:hypothetical protein